MTRQTRTQSHTGAVNIHEAHTKVTIDALGRTIIDGVNFEGDACSILGERLNQALGGGGVKEDKPEAFMGDVTARQSTMRSW